MTFAALPMRVPRIIHMLRLLLLLMAMAAISPHAVVARSAEGAVAAGDARFPFDALRQPSVAGDPNMLLPPEEAFKMRAIVKDTLTIFAEFTPAKGYYLYRDKFVVRVREPADVEVSSIEIPHGEIKDDPFFGKTEIFHNKVQALVHLRRSDARALALTLHVGYQGCNEPIGVCYSPIEKWLRLELPALTVVQ
jgi:thiol:disulfide interchange protein DsbD